MCACLFFPPWEEDLQVSVLLFLVKRHRVWDFVVDRFPFAEGLGVKRKDRKRICFFQVWEFRFGEEAIFLPVLINNACASFVVHSGVAVPWHKVKGERKGWRQVCGSKLTTALVQNQRDSAVLLQKQTWWRRTVYLCNVFRSWICTLERRKGQLLGVSVSIHSGFQDTNSNL